MKKMSFIAAIVLMALPALPVRASAEALDPKEPVTLELHDAKLTDVITTLGAMANLPVVIEPGLEGKVSIRMQEVPFEKILTILSKDNGISVRIEDGKLVASRAPGTSAAAPPAPDSARRAPRILLSDYARAASDPPPLLIRVTWKGEERCLLARAGSGGGGVAEIPLSGPGSDSGSVFIADLGYEPASKTRALAIEALGGSAKKAFLLGGGDDKKMLAFGGAGDKSLRLLLVQAPVVVGKAEACASLDFRAARGDTPVTVAMQATSLADSASSAVFSPRIQAMAGTLFKARGEDPDPAEGALRGYAVSGYVSRDGTAVAVAFLARAVLTDPEDGKQYAYTQVANSADFVPLQKAGVLASRIAAGFATARPLELKVFGGE